MDKLVENLRAILGHDAVLADVDELLVYECDGLPQHKHRPRAVVFPSSTEQTSAVMRVLASERIPFTPRGAGTGLSGGALALNAGLVIEMARMRKILKIDPENRIAVVQPGVVNAHVSRAAAPFGLHYVPDPSSNSTCTIGGNIAESAGGIHCLKYGTTTDHVLGARVVLSTGEVVELSGWGVDQSSYDLVGTFVGSEGTFGIVTEATLRLVPIPPTIRTLLADFLDVDNASHAVSAIIAAGVMPAALEMMDHEIIQAVEASVFAAGLPIDADAALLIELDGIEAGIDDEAERVKSICMQYGARDCRSARDENERKKLWAARKGAFGAIGRIAPDSMIQDAVVPRSRLPAVLADAYRIASKYQLRIANVFHAGDGNLHPLICFDSRSPDEVRRVKEAGRELMETCVRAGGSITGEHGVGLDKRELLPLIFSDDDLETMLRVRAAFDPLGILNPGKIIPLLRGCGEGRAVASLSGNGKQNRETPETMAPGAQAARLPLRDTPSQIELDNRAVDRPGPSALKSKIVTHTASQTLTVEATHQSLRDIVGEANVSVSPRLPFSASVLPGSIEEISEIIRLAASEHWPIVPMGAGTWLDAINGSANSGVRLNSSRLNRIIEHEPADLIATAQAGVTLADFNAELMKRGQWLPLDPPDEGRATLGGVIATGISGAQRCGYGPPRSYVIGMRVALASGKVVKVGGRVVKNVAGYDLCKLFTGSYGSLGVITEITFKVRPRPRREVTVVASASGASLFQAARAILDQRLFPVALELVSARMAREVEIEIDNNEQLLLARFAGNEKGVEFQSTQARTVLKSHEITEIGVVSEDDFIWTRLAAAPLKFSQHPCWRANVQPSELGRMIECAAGYDGALWQAAVADGRILMIDHALEAKGNTPFEEINNTPPDSVALQNLRRRIKDELDPQHVFYEHSLDKTSVVP